MTSTTMNNMTTESFLTWLESRNPNEPEFTQAVTEVVKDLIPFIKANKKYQNLSLLERLTEPDRIISFRVSWEDDEGNVQVNRAYRVQFNNCIGPYKGGMRFHPSVNASILKFLGFEQILKNSLTGLPMGGAKGGANFDPKGKSDREIMRFCQALMTELSRHIGESTDIPAGDIGVGAREIGYLFAQYKRIQNCFVGTITGKGIEFGGSLVRKEATGYGAVYFMKEMLAEQKKAFENRTCLVSGSGNVAIYCIEKLIDYKTKVLTASDSSGTVYLPDGFTRETLAALKQCKEVDRKRLSEFAKEVNCEYFEGKKPWEIDSIPKAELAFPCATQNELLLDDAKALVSKGLIAVSEGANMPCDEDAIETFKEAGVLYAPGKASNAGGVAVSGLEQSQNSLRIGWSRDEVDTKLQEIMANIHEKCLAHGKNEDGSVDYQRGANIAGFVKVADAMLSYGIV